MYFCQLLNFHGDYVYFIYLFYSNQQNVFSLINIIRIMNASLAWKNRLYEQNQVDAQTCCGLTIRSLSVNSNQTKSSIGRKKSGNKSHQKGISLIHNSVSLQKLATSRLKLTVQKVSQKFNNAAPYQKEGLKKDAQFDSSQGKSSKLTRRCVKYKNKRIQQRNSHSKRQQFCNTSLKKQDELSTCKDTPRIETFRYYDQGQLLAKSTYSNFSANAIDSVKERNHINHINANELKFPSVKTTFEKLYEEQAGRNIVTIQSHQTETEDLLDYSLINSVYIIEKTS